MGPAETWAKYYPKRSHADLERVVTSEPCGQELPCTTWSGSEISLGAAALVAQSQPLRKPGQRPELSTEELCFQAYSWNLNYSH